MLTGYFTPWLWFALTTLMVIISRQITNQELNKEDRFERSIVTGVLEGVPAWVSLMAIFGFVGQIVSTLWAFRMGWWGPIPPFILYGYVNSIFPSAITILTATRKAITCMHQEHAASMNNPAGISKLNRGNISHD